MGVSEYITFTSVDWVLDLKSRSVLPGPFRSRNDECPIWTMWQSGKLRSLLATMAPRRTRRRKPRLDAATILILDNPPGYAQIARSVEENQGLTSRPSDYRRDPRFKSDSGPYAAEAGCARRRRIAFGHNRNWHRSSPKSAQNSMPAALLKYSKGS
jgi:hypothetical protein